MSAQAKGSDCTFWRSFMIGCAVPCIVLWGRHVQSCGKQMNSWNASWCQYVDILYMQVQFFGSLTVNSKLSKCFKKSFAPFWTIPCVTSGCFDFSRCIRQILLEVFPSHVAWHWDEHWPTSPKPLSLLFVRKWSTIRAWWPHHWTTSSAFWHPSLQGSCLPL